MEEIENFLHESLLLSFNTEMEDGSIEDVVTVSFKLYFTLQCNDFTCKLNFDHRVTCN